MMRTPGSKTENRKPKTENRKPKTEKGFRLCLAALASLLVARGCVPVVKVPSSPTGGNVNRNAAGGGITGQVRSFLSDVQLSGDQTLSLFYDVSDNATSVTAFYVPVADASPGSPQTGAEVVLATGLPTGVMRQVTFMTGNIPRGIYRLGIQASNASQSARFLSVGTLQIQGPPAPVFISPGGDVTGQVGTVISIRFDAGDPEGHVQWRLFYEGASAGGSTPVPIDQRGTQLAVGAGNAGVFLWDTSGVAPGVNVLGVSATDSGSSVAGTVASGDLDRIVTVISS
ncbi:MAG TPA: hypothetical protein VGM03_17985, partial [Phycisphaerae bacterium]